MHDHKAINAIADCLHMSDLYRPLDHNNERGESLEVAEVPCDDDFMFLLRVSGCRVGERADWDWDWD